MQQQQPPGPQYGAQSPTDLTPFPSRPQFSTIHPEAPSPISSRPPPVQNYGELATAAAGSFHEDDVLAAGEEAERGGTPGNRWPREETLALLKIRSEMDAAFKDASLKGPLWENVSRKLGELGYIRSAKKCKEKFENVHKYYKRTKEGRAGRQDGKSYRFFTQLEALHTTTSGGVGITGSGSGSSTPTTAMPNPIPALPAAAVAPTWASIQPSPPSISAPPPVVPPLPLAPATTPPPSTVPQPQPHATAATGGISFSSDTFSSSSYESDDEDTEEGGASAEGRKRKRGNGGPGGRKMMNFFESLMMQVMQKQEAMQQRFLETIEKREQDRTAREEAWRRQEMARLNREHEMLAQERAVAASRDAALISFLQKIGGGQAIQVPPPAAPSPRPPSLQTTPPPRPPVVHITPSPAPVPAPAPAPTQHPQQEVPKETIESHPVVQHQHIAPAPPAPVQVQQQQAPRQSDEIQIAQNQTSSSCTELVPVPVPEQLETAVTPKGAFEMGVSPSRWPKSEVHALIKLRSGLEGRYQEAGPKGPLWEEISAGMQRLGYNRSSKRCKEKWENINKYFKKVKESNKKRPEDAKTCPYFHQLDALYRKKNLGSTSNTVYSIENNPQGPPPPSQPLPPAQALQAPQPIQIQPETERKSETEKNAANSAVNPGGGIQIQTSNGGLPSSFFEGGTAAMNKPEDIMKELMEQQHRRQAAMNNYNKMEQPHTDHNMYQDDEDDDDEDDEDDEDANMVYKMQFERQNVGNGGGGGGNSSSKPAATTTAGSFLGMVQ